MGRAWHDLGASVALTVTCAVLGAPLSLGLLWVILRLEAYYEAVFPPLSPAEYWARIAPGLVVVGLALLGGSLVLYAAARWGASPKGGLMGRAVFVFFLLLGLLLLYLTATVIGDFVTAGVCP